MAFGGHFNSFAACWHWTLTELIISAHTSALTRDLLKKPENWTFTFKLSHVSHKGSCLCIFCTQKETCIVYDGLLGLVRWSSQVAHRVSFLFHCVLRVYGNMIIFSVFFARSFAWPVGKETNMICFQSLLYYPFYGHWESKNRKKWGFGFFQMAGQILFLWGLKTLILGQPFMLILLENVA